MRCSYAQYLIVMIVYYILYTLPNSAIIGAPDTRVPYFEQALFAFYRNNIIPAVRNIGGLGIISDKGF